MQICRERINSLVCNVFFISVSALSLLSAWVSCIYCTALLLTPFQCWGTDAHLEESYSRRRGLDALCCIYLTSEAAFQHRPYFNGSVPDYPCHTIYRNFLDLPSGTKCSPSSSLSNNYLWHFQSPFSNLPKGFQLFAKLPNLCKKLGKGNRKSSELRQPCHFLTFF